jgi:putative ABC transport system permease protein
VISDLRFALRQLLKTPGFTLLALFTLALGIGLNSAIFSLINDLFLRGLSFDEPKRVVHIYGQSKERNYHDFPLSWPRFEHYREAQKLFSGLAAENGTAFTLTGFNEPVEVFGGRVTSNYFDLLGVRPIRGRTFLPEEEKSADVAMVTEGFWRSRLGGDPNVVGRSITLDGVAHTIVGVLPNQPAAWFGTNPVVEVWTTKPFVIPGISYERVMRGSGFLRVIGRLKSNVTLQQVKAALPSLEQSYRTQNPGKIDLNLTTTIKTLPEDVTENIRPAFITLFAAVAFVLLIACSNVANLLLVRFNGRRREIALRLAIGASRACVVRLFGFESLLIGGLAGILGAVLAWELIPLIPRMAANFLPIEPSPGVARLSLPVLGFTTAISILTALAVGIYPSCQGSSADLVSRLKEGGRGTSGSVHQQRFRKILVAGQVALSVTLLAGAALVITSFINLSRQSLGFNARNLWVGLVAMPQAQYPDLAARNRLAQTTTDALRNVPGFVDATVSSDFPLSGPNTNALYARPEGDIPPVDRRLAAPSHDVAPGYFRNWSTAILSGRDFNEHDLADTQPVMLISESGARKLFGNENPLGRRLLLGGSAVPTEIVGVVGDVRTERPTASHDVEFYRPWAQENFPFMVVTVRSHLPPQMVTKLVQTAMSGIDPRLAIAQPSSMDAIVAQALGQPRLLMILLGGFAGVAFLLALVGIYGAVAYTVEQRKAEIGVRMALGAQMKDVLRLVVKQGMNPVLFGLAGGLVSVFAAGRLLATQLYQISPHNPLLLALSVAGLAMASLLACLIPARRATLIDPIRALRTE